MQQRASGVIPITDVRMTRFWITLDQGVNFVISSLEQMRGGEIFVPNIPSMKVIDVAKVVAPECRTEIIGIRPGEKLHEIMIAEDDAINTVEFEHHYAVQPAAYWWDLKACLRKIGVRPAADNFHYSSDSNPQWLTSVELAEILAHESIEI